MPPIRQRPPLFRRDVIEDVDEELASHLEMRQHELVTQGLSPKEAQAIAERRFGNRPAIARACREIDERWYREQRRAGMWSDVRQDVRYAVRLLLRAPGFSVAAVVTLALGLGATTAMFSVANWALLRPLPGIRDASALEQIWVGRRNGENSFTPSRVSYANLDDLRPRLRTVDLAGRQSGSVNIATTAHPARTVPAEFVSANYFDVLGVPFGAGRPFTVEEDRAAGASHVAVMSETMSRSLFGSTTGALGQTVSINGIPFTVIGIPAGSFAGTHRIRSVSLWLPGASNPAVYHMPTLRYDERTSGGFYDLLGRPRYGHTIAQVDEELKGVAAWLATEYPKENAKFKSVGFHLLGGIGVDPLARNKMASSVRLMLGLSGIVLLIACSNVASLLLMRGIGRRQEVAVRTALGAGRVRLIRQHLTEGVVLWTLGGLAGLGFVWIVLQVVSGAALLGLRGELGPVPLDWRVAAFAFSLALLVGLLFATLPALSAAKVNPGETLKDGAKAAPRNLRIGSALSVLQLALSLALVLGALLLASTLNHLARVDLGFDPTDVHMFSVQTGSVGYTADESSRYRDEFARRLALMPGVERVASGATVPFWGRYSTRLRATGTEAYVTPAATQLSSPGLFDALRIPLKRGRVFTAEDLGGGGRPPRDVVVISERLSQQLFGAADAIGRTIEYGTLAQKGRIYEVIGVVGDIRSDSVTEEMPPMVHEAADPAFLQRSVTFVVRARPGAGLAAEVRAIAAGLNNALPAGPVTSLQERIDETQLDWTTLARVMTTLAAIAAVVAGVGLYGVVAFGVASRQREFGIRMALGATRGRVMTMVLRRTAVLTVAGLLLGWGGGIVLTRTLEARLFGVSRFDPAAWILAGTLMVAVALFACWIPTRRAATVEVTDALRSL